MYSRSCANWRYPAACTLAINGDTHGRIVDESYVSHGPGDQSPQGRFFRQQPGRNYIIAGPPYSLLGVLNLASRTTGIPAPRLRPDPRLIRGLAR